MSAIGIDINGLTDVSVTSSGGDVLCGGDVPSVVVLPEKLPRLGRINVIAGDEASKAIEGRGWDWPESSHVDSETKSLRIPVIKVIEALYENEDVSTAHGKLDAKNMLGSVIDALAGPGVRHRDNQIIISIADDQRMSDEVQQKILNAAADRGIKATLLWRSVASALALEDKLSRAPPDRREKSIRSLSGKTVGIVSFLNEGISSNCLEIETEEDDKGSYIVPVRRKRGHLVKYTKSITELGASVAADDKYGSREVSWQLLWGEGVVLKWLLGLQSKPAFIRTNGCWRKIDGNPPTTLPPLHLSSEALDELSENLKSADYLIYEGPALEAPAPDESLLWYIRGVVKQGRQSLVYQGKETYLASRGAVVYAERRESDRKTYYDYLPQIRLAVRRKNKPTFIPLIDEEERVDGGEPFEKKVSLGFSINGGANSVSFYILREGVETHRHAKIPITPPSEDVPVSMIVRQRPAQGRARLTIHPTDGKHSIPPIEVNWDYMEESDLSEEEIIEVLKTSGIEVPPVIPHPCHPYLWTHKPGGYQRKPSLEELVIELLPQIGAEPSDALMDEIKKIRKDNLTPYISPYDLSGYRQSERERQRAISSEGDFPEGLTEDTKVKFDALLSSLGDWVGSPQISPKLRNAILLMGSWTFLKCPEEIKAQLASAWENNNVTRADLRIYFLCMGRCFDTDEEIFEYFKTLEKDLTKGKMLHQHVYSLFHLLSLRDKAPRLLTSAQADLFVRKTLSRLEEEIRKDNYDNLVRTCLKALAALIRYRQENSAFLAQNADPLRDWVLEVLNSILQSHRPDLGIKELAKSTLEWVENRGTDITILTWDD